LAQQIAEAFPWDAAPAYLVRDNDGAYGPAFTRRIRMMGIRDRPISPRSPWHNPYVERLIGTLRRDCLDHVLIFGEPHLRRVLTSYSLYYNEARAHLGLGKGRAATTSRPAIWGHRRYANPVRIASLLRADMIFRDGRGRHWNSAVFARANGGRDL
jgi:transposase InsO family protein